MLAFKKWKLGLTSLCMTRQLLYASASVHSLWLFVY
jgi:hypothetical protein